MISPDPLDRLVEQNTFAEMLALLQPEELVVAGLRLEGLTDAQIGALLGIERSAVCWRMERARLRIMEALPELAVFLRDRQHPSHQPVRHCPPPLERGWLCTWDGDDAEPVPVLDAGLSVPDVARRYGVTRQTVIRWIQQGRFPNAYWANVGRGAHRIPEQDLVSF